MAKKKDKKEPKSRADQVRAAVEQAFQATAEQAEQTRGRAQDIADELAGVATRLREALDELRPPTADEIRALSSKLDDLDARVRKLETGGAAKAPRAKAAPKPSPRKPAAARGSTATKAQRASSTRGTRRGSAAGGGPAT